ncbi:plasmid pRiA4b ORF-3 family protein [Arthrobacter sp. ISL-72]|uniref:plasmid pRiA4b ORF-3 family protein n=1 Tax=Arthrobacter sp. ISL-72 TaxID=2819114 RepID=UPI002034DBC2|nr:plasmid pRiA4b ORF-3 family protein [Arthrobacter sp. ISL-72]
MEKLEAGTGGGPGSILEVRVELVDSEPEIWRRLEVRGSLALNQVHLVLQAAFGWEDPHLHRFTTDNPFAPLRPVDGEVPEALQWLPGQECEEPEDRPEEDCSLDQLLALGAGGAFYEYDFGDGRLHRLELVSRRPAEPSAPLVHLLDGARRGPLEDSGGFPGYEEVMDALADPSHPDHAEYSNWVAEITGSDEPFDPAFLDVPAITRALADQFEPRGFGITGPSPISGTAPFCDRSPAHFETPITEIRPTCFKRKLFAEVLAESGDCEVHLAIAG